MVKVFYYKCQCGHHGDDRIEGEPPFGKWNGKCITCGKPVSFYKVVYDPKEERQFERCNVDSMMVDHPRYSVSLGVLDEGLADAKRLHPQAEWKKFGSSWRPLIKNRAEKLKIMKQADYFEY